MSNSLETSTAPDRSSSSTQSKPRQRLWPLFGLALVLVAVGFYLALSGVDERAADQAAAPVARADGIDIPSAIVESDVEPIELRYTPSRSHQVQISLGQASRVKRPDGPADRLETTFELGIDEQITPADDRPVDATDQALAVTRRYRRARAVVRADKSRRIGPDITSQVEKLLEGSVTRTTIAPDGEPLDFQWREVPNPQARRMLYLLRDAHLFLTPRFFGGKLNPGDTWSYQRPMAVSGADGGVIVDGQVTIDNRFEGIVAGGGGRRLGVVRQSLGINAEGTVDSDDVDARFVVDGSGTGVVLVDVAAGKLYGVDIDLERTLEVTPNAAHPADEPTVQTSDIRMFLRPAGGLSLSEQTSVDPHSGDQPADLDASNHDSHAQ